MYVYNMYVRVCPGARPSGVMSKMMSKTVLIYELGMPGVGPDDGPAETDMRTGVPARQPAAFTTPPETFTIIHNTHDSSKIRLSLCLLLSLPSIDAGSSCYQRPFHERSSAPFDYSLNNTLTAQTRPKAISLPDILSWKPLQIKACPMIHDTPA